MANKFQQGDVVVLKSGGVPMTVDLCPGDKPRPSSSPMTVYRLVWQKGATQVQGVYGDHVLEQFVPPSK